VKGIKEGNNGMEEGKGEGKKGIEEGKGQVHLQSQHKRKSPANEMTTTKATRNISHMEGRRKGWKERMEGKDGREGWKGRGNGREGKWKGRGDVTLPTSTL
jgi:hypothetical protein